jgi:pimeloyl-ACP methyl ester carboxylesterase
MFYDDLEDGYVKTSLGMIHYRQHPGGGTKVTFIHGFASSTKSWVRLIEWLPDDINVCLVDLLGHGISDAPKIDYGAAIQARVVREFLEAKGMQDGCLFGHSYGGWIAALLAQSGFGGGGLVLEDAMGLKDYFEDLEKEGLKEAFNDRWIEEARIFGLADYVIKSSVGADKVTDALTKESLGSLSKQAMLIWGGKDGVVSTKYAELFAEYIKGSDLEILEGAGHVPHYTNAEEVAGLLLGFIGHQGSSGSLRG